MGFANYDARKANTNKVEAKEVTPIGTERVKYFDGIGKNVQKATSLETAIALSGLDFEVKKYPISFKVEVPTTIGTVITNHNDFPDQYATVRTDTMTPLGVVGRNYEILQNIDAFNFLDSMVVEAKFETAGTYGGGSAKSFITMSTEPFKILDDEFTPYILFTNSFDGSGTVKAMFTPIRVFCSNCLVRAIANATHKISIRHSSSLKKNLDVARYVLLENTNYLDALKKESEKMAITPYSSEQFKALVKTMFGAKEDDTAITKLRSEATMEALLKAYDQADLQNFNNTVYKAVQAIADFESHKPAFRNTSSIMYKNINTVKAEMPLTNSIANMLMAA